MYEWLKEQLATIKTPKFHLVDGPASEKLREAVSDSSIPLPESYKTFVLEFGNSKLFRRNNYYLVEVFAGPREAMSEEGESLVHFGRTHTSLAYFKKSLLNYGQETPVFEWQHGKHLIPVAGGFSEWLTVKCASAKKKYTVAEWNNIERGPPPFSESEMKRVAARRQFQWMVIGTSPQGNLRFQIHNGSRIILPYLSVRIRGQLRPPRSGPLMGGVYLPVSMIAPGETHVIEHDCYKNLVAPEDVEVFALPDPGPEDREQYWEFKALPSATP